MSLMFFDGFEHYPNDPSGRDEGQRDDQWIADQTQPGDWQVDQANWHQRAQTFIEVCSHCLELRPCSPVRLIRLMPHPWAGDYSEWFVEPAAGVTCYQRTLMLCYSCEVTMPRDGSMYLEVF